MKLPAGIAAMHNIIHPENQKLDEKLQAISLVSPSNFSWFFSTNPTMLDECYKEARNLLSGKDLEKISLLPGEGEMS